MKKNNFSKDKKIGINISLWISSLSLAFSLPSACVSYKSYHTSNQNCHNKLQTDLRELKFLQRNLNTSYWSGDSLSQIQSLREKAHESIRQLRYNHANNIKVISVIKKIESLDKTIFNNKEYSVQDDTNVSFIESELSSNQKLSTYRCK